MRRWYHRLWRFVTGAAGAPGNRPATFRPTVEGLEERRVLSAFTPGRLIFYTHAVQGGDPVNVLTLDSGSDVELQDFRNLFEGATREHPATAHLVVKAGKRPVTWDVDVFPNQDDPTKIEIHLPASRPLRLGAGFHDLKLEDIMPAADQLAPLIKPQVVIHQRVAPRQKPNVPPGHKPPRHGRSPHHHPPRPLQPLLPSDPGFGGLGGGGGGDGFGGGSFGGGGFGGGGFGGGGFGGGGFGGGGFGGGLGG